MDNPTENAQRKDPDYNLEIGSDTPRLDLIMSELEQAETDIQRYYNRNCQAYDYWHCRWDGQAIDGCKHALNEEDQIPFPWEGAADGRLRLVDGQIREHLTVAMFAFKKAKIQANSVRPLVNARQTNQATQLLTWMVNTHMRDNLQREIPLAFASMFGYGASILAVEWEQERRLEEIEIKLEDLAALGQQGGQGSDQIGMQLMDAILDPAQEDTLTSFIQQMSPILSRTVARRVIKDLREKHVAKVPVPYVINSRPRMTALRIGSDILFPGMTDDLQSSRWISQRERVSETELRDRIETENYDPKFVEEALKTKGQTSDVFRLAWTDEERSAYGEKVTAYSSRTGTDNSYRDLIELHHFRYKAIEHGTPALYKTVFCPATLRKTGGKYLYATHGLDPYKHGLYPYVDLRFERFERAITSSRGIPEIMYTWEQEVKAQADGLTDHTSLVMAPPMFVPYSRVKSIQNTPAPRAIMPVSRPNEVNQMKVGLQDNTPIEVQQAVISRMDRFAGLFGAEVDPDLKNLRRQELGESIIDQVTPAYDMILKLCQDYLADDEIAQVVGNLARPFKVNRAEIQGSHQITATINMAMLDKDHAGKEIDLIMKMLPLDRGGRANQDKLFDLGMNLIDPDAADAIIDDKQTATERERRDERTAIVNAFSGIESDMPMFGNHELRLQTIMQDVFQSKNPEMQKRLAANPDTIEILKKRVQFHQNQITQYQKNPAIGRALTTSAFDRTSAPQVTQGTPAE